MNLTLRDRHLLQWINGHGFATVQQAATWMDVCYFIGWRRLTRLTEAGYLQRRRFEHGGPRVHWLTAQGWKVSGDPLKAPKAINRVTYFHDIMLVDLAQALTAETGGSFTPERRLRADLLAKGFRTRRHLPDGLLHLDGQKPIAIELECSMKEARRLRKIVTDYAIDTKFQAVWYFVTNNRVRRLIERATKPYSGFRIRLWEASHDQPV